MSAKEKKTEVKYGRRIIDGKRALVAIFNNEDGDEVKLVNFSYGPLKKYVNGEEVETTEADVWIATKVAGWQGNRDTLRGLEE